MLKTEGYENSQLFMALTPKNGVKASKLYSYKPIDGTGDFHWSRNHTAYRLNQEGVLELMGNNVPRVDYTNTCPELLIEKASTNICLHSEDLTNVAYTLLTSTITSNNIESPNGNLTGDRVNLTAGTANKGVAQFISIGVSENRTFYVFAKEGSHRFIQLQIDGTFSFCNFDLQTGVSGTPNLCTANIVLINGWYRCEINYNSTRITPIVWAVDSLVAGGAATTSSTGNFYLWGFQSEVSDYATSYIPTTNATQTRVKDVCYNTANGYNDADWSVVMRVRLNNIGSSADEPLLALSDGTTDYYFAIYTDSNPKLHFTWYNNPDQDTYSTSDLSNGIVNVGVSFDSVTAEYIIVIDGTMEFAGTLVNNAPGLFGNFNRLDLGSIVGTGSPDKDGIIGIQYYDSALSQSSLENLTA